MKSEFANILSALRRENGLSQKKAADGLGISQALLSHYENGIREPKLEFVLKACEYYGVSSDYILGRTSEKTFDGVSLKCQNDGDKRNADAASLIISMLSELGDAQLAESASNYMNFSIFVMASALRSKLRQYEPLLDAAMKLAEAAFVSDARRVVGSANISGKLSDEAFREKYPKQFAAMLEMEEMVGKAVSSLQKNNVND